MSEEWFNLINPKFHGLVKYHELVRDTATKYPCNIQEVLDVCSEWLTNNSMNLHELELVLRIYGGLRVIGQDHASTVMAMRPFSKVGIFRTIKEHKSIPKFRLIRED
jgi:hypothetical protein